MLVVFSGLGVLSFAQAPAILTGSAATNAPNARRFGRGFIAPADQPSPRRDRNSQLAHEQLLEKAKKGGIDAYFIGDSITRRWGALDYPDLDRPGSDSGDFDAAVDGERGDVFVTLVEQDGVMVAEEWARERPTSGPYLACSDRGWDLRCGIESWFLPQDEAARMEEVLRGGAIAEVRIDGRGHAALVDVRAP